MLWIRRFKTLHQTLFRREKVEEQLDEEVLAYFETLIERYGYLIKNYHLNKDGHCPKCSTAIPGRW